MKNFYFDFVQTNVIHHSYFSKLLLVSFVIVYIDDIIKKKTYLQFY